MSAIVLWMWMMTGFGVAFSFQDDDDKKKPLLVQFVIATCIAIVWPFVIAALVTQALLRAKERP